MFVLCDECNRHYEDMSDSATCPHRWERTLPLVEHLRNVRDTRLAGNAGKPPRVIPDDTL